MKGDFAMVPICVIRDARLSCIDRRVLETHWAAADRTSWVSRWSQARVANFLACSRRSVIRAELKLADLGYIRSEPIGRARAVHVIEKDAQRLTDWRDGDTGVTTVDQIGDTGVTTVDQIGDSAVTTVDQIGDSAVTSTGDTGVTSEDRLVTPVSISGDTGVTSLVTPVSHRSDLSEQEPEEVDHDHQAPTPVEFGRAPNLNPRRGRPGDESSPVRLVSARWNIAAARHPVLQQHLAGAQHQILAMWEEFKVGAERRGCTPVELFDEALRMLTVTEPERIAELNMATLHGAAKKSETYAVSKLMALVSGLYNGGRRASGGKRESTTSWRHTKDTHIAPDIDAPQPEGMF